MQVSANGGGTPIASASASNGTVASLAMSGKRLEMSQFIALQDIVAGTSVNTSPIYGVLQA